MERINQSSIDALLELIGGDVDSLHELIQSYIDEASFHSQNLANGLSDVELLGRTAHSLKSSSRDFGAMALSNLCLTLEQQAKNDSLVDEADQVTRIQLEIERCVHELSRIKSNRESV